MFRSKYFWLHIALMVLTILLVIFLAFNVLKVYTRHGEKIAIPDLKEKNIETAKEIVAKEGFEIVITDSLFIVGKYGGLILAQNPLPGAFAKSGRTIYVTISKYSPDMVSVASLPALYGKSFDLKKKVLLDGFEINSEIVGEKFDKGLPGMILKVINGHDTIIDENGIKADVNIPRGSTLKFIVSSKEGGAISLPDFNCLSYDEALFFASTNNLKLAVRSGSGGTYVIGQSPEFAPDAKINRGDSIWVDLSERKPENCPVEEE